MRLILGTDRSCPDCGCVDLRESRHRPEAWERLLFLRRFRCRGCWRRLVVFRPSAEQGRIYNRG